MNKEQMRWDKVERARLVKEFQTTSFWPFFKSYLKHCIDKLNNINIYALDDFKDVQIKVRINHAKLEVYNSLLNLLERTWIQEGDKAQKNIKE